MGQEALQIEEETPIMAIPHAKPIEPVSVCPLGEQLRSAQTTTLVKSDALEVIRLILPAGKELDRLQAPAAGQSGAEELL